MIRRSVWSAVLVLTSSGVAAGQSSSLYLEALEYQDAQRSSRQGQSAFVELDDNRPINPELERASIIAVKTPPPNQFELHDLISVIVREQKDYRSDASLEREKNFRVRSQLEEFLRFTGGHLGAATFGDGMPNIDYQLDTRSEGEGDAERTDRLSFRIEVEIIDIKPNGLLVLAGRKQIQVDEDLQQLLFTGVCRSADISVDNTVLSSQVFDQHIDVQHEGPLKDAAKRGWLTKLIDVVKPF